MAYLNQAADVNHQHFKHQILNLIMGDHSAKNGDTKLEKSAGSKFEDLLSLRTAGNNPERLRKWFERMETWCDTELETPGISKILRGSNEDQQLPELVPPVPPQPKNKLQYQHFLRQVKAKEREFELYEQAVAQYEVDMAEYNLELALYEGGIAAANGDAALIAEIGDAPEQPEEPEVPEIENLPVVVPVFDPFEDGAHKRECAGYEDKVRQRNRDLIKLYGKMKTEMATDSMTRIREQPEFPSLEQKKDPVKLSQLIVQTHVGGSNFNDPEEIADNIIWAFQRIKQGEKEHLSEYRDRFEAIDDSLNIAREKAKDDTFRISESRKIRMFVRGLNPTWSQFKNDFARKQLETMPTSINDPDTGVYAIARKYRPDRIAKGQVTDGNSKLAFQSTVRPQQNKRCTHCEQDGHFEKTCFYKNKSKAEAMAKAKEYREAKVKKQLEAGGGAKSKPN